jgi:hypothetical protein
MSIASQIAQLEEQMVVTQRQLERAEARERRDRTASLARADNARQLTGREHLMQVHATARAYQAKADDSFQPWGIRAPAPVAGESLDTYRRELLIKAKKLLPDDHPLRSVQVRQLAADALTVMEPQIYDACHKAAYEADSVPPGQLRQIEERDANGLKIVKFIGQRCFTDQFTIPGKRVRIRPFTDFRNSAAQ